MNRPESKNDFAPLVAGQRYSGEAATTGAHPAAHEPSRARPAHEFIKLVPFSGLLTNHLLTALPGEDFARLLPYLEPVSLSRGEALYGFGEDVRDVYFPESAVIANLYVLEDGSTTEAAMIGKDGMTGLSTLFSSSAPTHWTQVIIPGTALRMCAETLKAEFARGGAMQHLLLAYTGARIAQLSQRAVCNGRHAVAERLCSWLLMILDRAGDTQLPLTHEQIARHLGTRRAGISEATTALRAARLINYGRGKIRITDRQGLEMAACECYRALKQRTLTSAQSLLT